QGVAEERARIDAMLKGTRDRLEAASEKDKDDPEHQQALHNRAYAIGSVIMLLGPSPDLLPPGTARAALDAERRKVSVMRQALNNVMSPAMVDKMIEDA